MGRTGSGKSTMLLVLMRIIELAKEEGDMFIKVSGQKIGELGLHWVRRAIEIIP